MQIPLDDFEFLIDSTKLEKGFKLFEKGAIIEAVDLTNDEYQLSIKDRKMFETHIHLHNRNITPIQCTCEDAEIVCRHVAAALLYFQGDQLLDLKEASDIKNKSAPRKTKTKSSAPKTKSVNAQIKSILKELPVQVLIEFIEKKAIKDKAFQGLFLSEFGHLGDSQSMESYQKQVAAAIKGAKGRRRLMTQTNKRAVAKAIEPYLTNTQQFMESGKYEDAFYIIASILFEIADQLSEKLDQLGALEKVVESSIEHIHYLINADISKSLAKEIFNFTLEIQTASRRNDWYWMVKLLKESLALVQTKLQAARVIQAIEASEYSFFIDKLSLYKYQLLEEYYEEKEVTRYLKTQEENQHIRYHRILKAFEEKEYKIVRILCEEGLNLLRSYQDPTVWYEMLARLGNETQDKPLEIEANKRLLYFGRNEKSVVVKKLHELTGEQWGKFRDEMIIEISESELYEHPFVLPHLFIFEERWQEYFDWVFRHQSIEAIDLAVQHLPSKYNNPLAWSYSNALQMMMYEEFGRGQYQMIVERIKTIISLGVPEAAEELVEIIRDEQWRHGRLVDMVDKIQF